MSVLSSTMTAEDLAKLYVINERVCKQSSHLMNLFGMPDKNILGCLWFENGEPKMEVFRSSIKRQEKPQKTFRIGTYKGKTNVLVDCEGNLVIKPIAIWSTTHGKKKQDSNEIVVSSLAEWGRFWKRIMEQEKYFTGYPFTYNEF